MSAPPFARLGRIWDYEPDAAPQQNRISFESVAEILSRQGIGPNTLPDKVTPAAFPACDLSSGISKHKLRQLHSITLVREQRERGRQEIGYHTRPFVLCGIPLRRPSRDPAGSSPPEWEVLP